MTAPVIFAVKHNAVLDLVNEEDVVIGQALRSDIHAQGLLHREVHVWMITPSREVIFQKRSMSKDTFPGLLGTSVGGHAEAEASALDLPAGQIAGMDEKAVYRHYAAAELQEETGLTNQPLIWIRKRRATEIDAVKGTHNEAFVGVYALLYSGSPDDLKVESGEAEGFVAIPLTKLLTLTDAEKAQFLPILTGQEHLGLYQQMVDRICGPLAPAVPIIKAAPQSTLSPRTES